MIYLMAIHLLGKDMSSNLCSALFDDDVSADVDGWDLPRLKIPEKGEAVAKSLANLINTACTSQCETDNLLAKYKVPQNCDMACPPVVNNEIWKIMDRQTQSRDRGLVDTQNLLVTSMVPIIKLAETLKSHIALDSSVRGMLADALTLIGQVQFNLSVRRRYMIRPVMKKKYHSLCNVSMPVTTKLFGEDVSKDIKSCDSLGSIGKDQYYPKSGYSSRGRGYSGRGSYNSNYNNNYQNNNRFQPYQRGQRKSWNRNFRFQKKSASATATTSNDQTQ